MAVVEIKVTDELQIGEIINKDGIVYEVIDINKKYIHPVYTIEDTKTNEKKELTIIELAGGVRIEK